MYAIIKDGGTQMWLSCTTKRVGLRTGFDARECLTIFIGLSDRKFDAVFLLIFILLLFSLTLLLYRLTYFPFSKAIRPNVQHIF